MAKAIVQHIVLVGTSKGMKPKFAAGVLGTFSGIYVNATLPSELVGKAEAYKVTLEPVALSSVPRVGLIPSE